MIDCSAYVDLGFAEVRLPAGTHICQIYRDEDERNDALLKFLLHGLRAGECNACFSRDISEETLRTHFSHNGISLDESVRSGALSLAEAEDIYFKNGRFDPDLMLDSLAAFYSRAVNEGYRAARVIGEMLPEIIHCPGGERLLEYESRVTLFLRNHPLTTVCQYDAHAFDGATIMDILKVHPMMVVRGTVIHNPFFVAPEDFLGK
jgi:hypothetical protein